MLKTPCIFYTLCLFSDVSLAQNVGIGKWRDHLPYNEATGVAEAGNKIYCGTSGGLFCFNKQDNSIQKFSKANVLSDVNISAINFSPAHNVLVVAYSNTNIDLIENEVVINLSDIKRKSITGNKTINNIYFTDQFAMLACGFGIVKLDIVKKEIKDTYFIGSGGSQINVKDITTLNDTIYAATEQGVYKAATKQNLVDFAQWEKDSLLPTGSYNAIATFNGKVHVNFSSALSSTSDTIFVYQNGKWNHLFDYSIVTGWATNDIDVFNNKLMITTFFSSAAYDTAYNYVINVTTYNNSLEPSPKEAILDKDGLIWIADNKHGLIKMLNQWEYESVYPNGPGSKDVVAMDWKQNRLAVAPGGRDASWTNTWHKAKIYSFENEFWTNTDITDYDAFDTIWDVVSIIIDPSDKNRVYAGTWSRGILEFYNNSLQTIYTDKNSTLQPLLNWYWIGISGFSFDKSNQLWAINRKVANPLCIKKSDGSWLSLPIGNIKTGIESETGAIMIDDFSQKWVMMPGSGVAIFNDNNTIDNAGDDLAILITQKKAQDDIKPMTDIKCIGSDHDGEVWMGTSEGVVVVYSPENIMNGTDLPQAPLIQIGGYWQFLLETESVTAIAIDGANRKWFGTQKAGVFLMSEDATEQIEHFTTENSPLLSDNITSVAINHETGEVFFGTDKGIISYRGTATEGKKSFSSIFAFPNPVKEDYNGIIAIRGLVNNSEVKITDVAGTLIYQATALGGQVTWDGKNFSGEKAHTGVYLVFGSGEDGSQAVVTKILIIN